MAAFAQEPMRQLAVRRPRDRVRAALDLALDLRRDFSFFRWWTRRGAHRRRARRRRVASSSSDTLASSRSRSSTGFASGRLAPSGAVADLPPWRPCEGQPVVDATTGTRRAPQRGVGRVDLAGVEFLLRQHLVLSSPDPPRGGPRVQGWARRGGPCVRAGAFAEPADGRDGDDRASACAQGPARGRARAARHKTAGKRAAASVDVRCTRRRGQARPPPSSGVCSRLLELVPPAAGSSSRPWRPSRGSAAGRTWPRTP